MRYRIGVVRVLREALSGTTTKPHPNVRLGILAVPLHATETSIDVLQRFIITYHARTRKYISLSIRKGLRSEIRP